MLATEINPLTLPSVPLVDRRQLPDASGIYFVLSSDDKVQYIGRSVNLQQRWIQHHRLSHLAKLSGVRLAWLEVSDASLLPEIEQALIQWFNPPMNGSSVGTKKPRVVVCMDGELVRQIRVLAAMEGHSVSSYLESLAKREVEQARKKGVRFDLLSGSKNA